MASQTQPLLLRHPIYLAPQLVWGLYICNRVSVVGQWAPHNKTNAEKLGGGKRSLDHPPLVIVQGEWPNQRSSLLLRVMDRLSSGPFLPSVLPPSPSLLSSLLPLTVAASSFSSQWETEPNTALDFDFVFIRVSLFFFSSHFPVYALHWRSHGRARGGLGPSILDDTGREICAPQINLGRE